MIKSKKLFPHEKHVDRKRCNSWMIEKRRQVIRLKTILKKPFIESIISFCAMAI
jgi:hypothetical protein